MAKRLEILVTSGDLTGKRFEVPSAGLRLGRSSSSDIHIPDEELSRNHCFFECSGESDVTVIDLSSANGTYVNGEAVSSAPRTLKAGDEIYVGSTTLKMIGEEESSGKVASARPASDAGGEVDLGFGSVGNQPVGSPDDARQKVSPVLKIVTTAIVGVLLVSIAFVLVFGNPFAKKRAVQTEKREKVSDDIVSFAYEKVDADSSHVFRYAATLASNGELSIEFDDLPHENRQLPSTKKQITDSNRELLEMIFSGDDWKKLKDEYIGESFANVNAYKSWSIKLVRKNGVKKVVVENELEPEEFKRIREKLESTVNNILGVQSIERSREEIEKSVEDSEILADEFWDKRDVEYPNISKAIDAYTLARRDLSLLGASGDSIARIQRKIDEARKELDGRCKKRFEEAGRLQTIGDWEGAREEFAIIREMVPRRDDIRHRDAESGIENCEVNLRKIEKDRKGRRK